MNFYHLREIYLTNTDKNCRKVLLKQDQVLQKLLPIKYDKKAPEATGEFRGNKIVNKIVKPKLVIDENSRNVEEMIIPTEKRKIY